MSTVHQLAARLNGGADQLPVELVVDASDQLSGAAELLAWVRSESEHPLGLPELSGAIEHLEQAAFALTAVRECLAEYVVALGLAASAEGRTSPRVPRRVHKVPSEAAQRGSPEEPPPLGRWWAERVDALTEPDPPGHANEPGHTNEPGHAKQPGHTNEPGHTKQTSPAKQASRHRPKRIDRRALLRQVAALVRDRDRAALRRELSGVDPSDGLRLAAASPAELRGLASDLLGHPPTPRDLAALREATAEETRRLLPGLPPEVPVTLLGRVCRAATDQPDQPGGARQIHPADSAVAGAVLVGVLAARLGRDPAGLGHDPAEDQSPGEPAGQVPHGTPAAERFSPARQARGRPSHG